MCRICLEEGGQQFCSCTGTCGLVHAHCLQKWIDVSERDTCEICKAKYTFPVKFSPRFRLDISDIRLSKNTNTSAICCILGITLFLLNFLNSIFFKSYLVNIIASNITSILCVSFTMMFTNSLQFYLYLSVLVCMSNVFVLNNINDSFTLDLFAFIIQCILTFILLLAWAAKIVWRSSWIVSV